MSRRTLTTCRGRFVASYAILPAVMALASAAGATELHDHDNSPFTGYFGLPDSTEGGRLPAAGSTRWDAYVATSSHASQEILTDESLLLDGETTRFEWTVRHGVSDRFEVGLELPFILHESGGLDGLVGNWHELFGLPNELRASRQDDQLEFRYSDVSGPRVNLRQNARGIGDVRVFAGIALSVSEDHAVALRLGVKLPTGDSAQLLGSGGTDVSFGIAGDVTRLFGVPRMTGFYRAHAILTGKPDVLADLHRDFAGQLSFGAGYQVSDGFELRLQSSLRSAFYDSSVDILGDASGTISFGGNFRLSDDYWLSVGIGEDLIVDSAPDVTFLLRLQFRPH